MRVLNNYENSNPIYLDTERKNWLYKGIQNHFDANYAISPLSNEEFHSMLQFTGRMNQIRGYQDIWSCFTDESGRAIYIGISVPMTDNDFLLCLIFDLFMRLTNTIIIIVMYVILFRVFLSQKRLIHAYYTDQETQGHNWYYFLRYANRKIKRLNRRHLNYAMIQISMTNYATYCSCYGELESKKLVSDYYQTLTRLLPKKTCVARHDRSDFAILFTYIDKESLFHNLTALVDSLGQVRPNTSLRFSAGIYLLDSETNVDASTAYHFASIASSCAASNFSSPILFFNQEMHDEIQWERKLENDFSSAIKNQEFEIYLQPKYDVKTETIVAAEALIRWNHPTEGFLTPNKFIPFFEKNGFIRYVDDYMVSHLAELQSKRIEAGKTLIPISVNISCMHFIDENLAEHINQLVDSYHIPHEAIELELTESAFFDDKDLIIHTSNRLRDFGFHVSLDDFGTGYSSLNSLRELPIDIVKLDSGFFRGQGDEEKGKIIVSQIIHLANQLKIQVVAEGIETEDQVTFLANEKCDQIQGFYFAKPMPVADFETLVQSVNMDNS